MSELAEEFRDYARRSGQVMVSTHSPDLLNAVRLEEVLWLVKKDGLSEIRRAQDDAQVKRYMAYNRPSLTITRREPVGACAAEGTSLRCFLEKLLERSAHS